MHNEHSIGSQHSAQVHMSMNEHVHTAVDVHTHVSMHVFKPHDQRTCTARILCTQKHSPIVFYEQHPLQSMRACATSRTASVSRPSTLASTRCKLCPQQSPQTPQRAPPPWYPSGAPEGAIESSRRSHKELSIRTSRCMSTRETPREIQWPSPREIQWPSRPESVSFTMLEWHDPSTVCSVPKPYRLRTGSVGVG